MMHLKKNGFVIQLDRCSKYKGIDGDNWYFNYLDSDTYFETYFDRNIDLSWNNSQYVDCCNDIKFIKRYVEESKKQNVKYRILMCETPRSFPSIERISDRDIKFLGYDYAYAGGNYYSCIFNDILSERILEFRELKLNESLLFETIEDLYGFLELRKQLSFKYPDNTFESGDFVIYRLSEVINIDLCMRS